MLRIISFIGKWIPRIPVLKTLENLPLRHVILLSVVVSIILAECVVLSGAYIIWTRDQHQRLDKETLLMLKANVDATSYPTIEQTIKMGQRIASFSSVRGGAIYSTSGTQIASFGIRPAQNIAFYTRMGTRYNMSEDARYLDVFYPIDITGFANPMILRIDAQRIPEILKQQLEEKFSITLGIAFISSLVVVALLSFMIIRPILKLRDAVLKVADNPNEADKYRLGWRRTDEFGEVARAIDLLLTSVSVVYQEELVVGQEIVKRSHVGMLSYNPEGYLVSANEASLKLFGVSSLDSLSKLSSSYIRQQSGEGFTNVSPISLLSNRQVRAFVDIVTSDGIKKCFMSAVTINRPSGAVLRYAVSLIDLSEILNDAADLNVEAESLRETLTVYRRKNAEMRALFRSCLILLSHAQQQVQTASTQDTNNTDKKDSTLTFDTANLPIVLTDRVVTAWYSEALNAQLIKARLEHGVLPPVRGAPDNVETIFRQAFMSVYAQSDYQSPMVAIKAEPSQPEQHIFEIWEDEAEADAPLRDPNDPIISGAALAIASLKHSLSEIGGILLPLDSKRNAVRFSLYTAAFDEVDEFTLNKISEHISDEEIIDLTAETA